MHESREILETAIAAAIIHEPEEAIPRLTALRPVAIRDPRVRVVIAAALEIHAAGAPLDLPTLAAALDRAGDLAPLGGFAALEQLAYYWPNADAVAHHIAQLREQQERERFEAAATRAAARATDRRVPLAELVAETRGALDHLADETELAPRIQPRSLAAYLAHPGALEPPRVVAPLLAWEGRATMLAGREKAGKSSLAGAAAAAVSRGAPFLDAPTHEGPVLWCALDEPEGDVVRRLHAAGADPDGVFIVGALPGGLADLMRFADAVRPRLLVLDSWTPFASPQVESFNDAAQVSRVVQPLCRFTRQRGIALLILHHATKQSGYRDSTALGAEVDVILELSDPEDLATPGLRKVKARGRVGVSDYEVRWDAVLGRYSLPNRESLSLDFRIVEYVAAHPLCSGRDIEGAMGGKASTVREAIRRLKAFGRLVDQPGARGAINWTVAALAHEAGTHSGRTGDALDKTTGTHSGRGADALGTHSGTHSPARPRPVSIDTDAGRAADQVGEEAA